MKNRMVYYFLDNLMPIYPLNVHSVDDIDIYGYLEDGQEAITVLDQEDVNRLVSDGKVIAETSKQELVDRFEEIHGKIDLEVDFTPDFDIFDASNLPSKRKRKEEKRLPHPSLKVPKNYNPELSNTTRTANKLSKMMKVALAKKDKPDCISLLFHGAPGTGKSIAAAYLAKTLKKEIKSYNISDLQSKYIGESETLITNAFREAMEEGHILHMDEIDSLATDRSEADKEHSVKFANCLLQSMDTFKGIFIATSNFLDTLDPAILRRFTLKQEFFNVTDEQADKLSTIYFSRKAPKGLPNEVLAPADFDIVQKSLLFEEEKDITRKFIRSRLIEEAALRNGADLTIKKIPMGFATE